MPDARRRSWRARLLRVIGQVGPGRLAIVLLFVALAVLVARWSWNFPLSGDAERALYDLRFYETAHPTDAQDPRITEIVFNDDTLEQLGRRSPLDRRMLADALQAIDHMHPRAIGIDILLDQPQPEDSILLSTLQHMHTPTYLAFTTQHSNPEQMLYWQERFLREFIARAASGPIHPMSIRLEPDLEDGVIRRWPEDLRGLPPTLAVALTGGRTPFANYHGSVSFRVPRSSEIVPFTSLPIQLLASLNAPNLSPEMRATLETSFLPQIQNRYVLIGGDILDADDFPTPLSHRTGNPTKGLEVHANMLAQVLDGEMPALTPGWALSGAAALIVLAGAFTGLIEARGWRLAVILVGQIGFLVLLPFGLQRIGVDTIQLPAFGWVVGWFFAFLGTDTAARAVGSEQRRFAQSALGKYLPEDVAQEIIRNPDQLALVGEKRQIYALFTDLEGFTKLSHAIPAEQLSRLLNRYLDTLSDVVLKNGGTIDKFVGDAIVAFWGAPLARDDDGARAARAALEMFEAGEEFARQAKMEGVQAGRTRVGLHRGEAVVGNFGGQRRIQYTALGDGMNTASRLESANKALKTCVLVSDEARESCGLDNLRPMGRIGLSGRSTPVVVWEPAPWMDRAERETLATLWERFDAGGPDALAGFEGIAAAHPDDAALQELVYRLKDCGPGGCYVLGTK